MRYLYTTLLYFATPWILLRLLLRSRKNPAYRRRIKERLGFIPLINNKKSIWVHAVSLGELIAGAPLIKALQQQHPTYQLVVTTTTPTGSAEVHKRFGSTVYHVYTPFDLPAVIRRFIKRTHPVKTVIMETELWPNLIHELKRANIPTMIANARLSERSFAGYKRLAYFFKPLLTQLELIAAQSKTDAERFKILGAKKIVITGNIKFDFETSVELLERAKALKANWCTRPSWIAASTHEGEESIILSAFSQILHAYPDALLILVPRHPERFDKVAKLCAAAGFKLARRAAQELPSADTPIYLGDTLGELKLLYAASDVAFVGGSLMPIGGHNLIEPASLSLPVLSGPHLENFIAIRDLLQEAEGLVLIDNAQDLAAEIIKLFTDKNRLHLLGARALSVIDANRGAVQKHLQLISNSLDNVQARNTPQSF